MTFAGFFMGYSDEYRRAELDYLMFEFDNIPSR